MMAGGWVQSVQCGRDVSVCGGSYWETGERDYRVLTSMAWIFDELTFALCMYKRMHTS